MPVCQCMWKVVLSSSFVAVLALLLISPALGHEDIAKTAAPDDTVGMLSVGSDGKPLNLDFETGSLKDWTAEGEAFKEQPVQGDIPSGPKARGDRRADPQGEFWIGTYERGLDPPTGTLTSTAFKVTHPFATFLVGGGPHAQTRVEIVRKDTGRVVFAASGREAENMRRVGVDLREHEGNEIFLRVVDQHTGHWGHINFDDFRFHRVLPPLPKEPSILLPDQYPYAGLSPEKAAEVMTVPEGFKVALFAGEPDVHQPIAMAIDDRGRLWIAEAYVYPRRAAEGKGRDRIVIFEDTDGDGRHDQRKVFIEGLNLVSGLELGFGGVWVGAAPYLLFIPDRNGDDIPDGPVPLLAASSATQKTPDVAFPKDVPPGAKVLLDGWGYQDTHETLNGFIWGPDGWLYGCHGVFTHSNVGKPGTHDDKRTKINAGIWRYHPVRHEFEVFAEGTSNPWGVDFNDYGHAFATACVIPHLYHIIQGGRYQRQAGSHFNPHTYDDIKTIADHVHYLGPNPHAANSKSDSVGGGHAHAGAMIYLGGKWPEKYRGQIFMNNIHGQRINMDILEPRGSGYVGRHGPDFLLTNDQWSQIINLRYGPDGDVYMIDWYDKNACHHNDPNGHDRTNGRIFKVIYGEPEKVDVDLKKLSDLELAKLVEHKNDWYVRHSRRILQERAAERRREAAGKKLPRVPGGDHILPEFIGKAAEEYLVKTFSAQPDESRRLRALWVLHTVGSGMRIPDIIVAGYADQSPYIRAWSMQLSLEVRGRYLSSQAALQRPARNRADSKPIERLYTASAALRLGIGASSEALARVLAHEEDSNDHSLPLMYWYSIEPLAVERPREALDMALRAKIPQILPLMVRRIASDGRPESIQLLIEAIERTPTDAQVLAVLNGLNAALKGQRNVAAPAAWPEAFKKLLASKNDRMRSQARTLAATFGDAATLAVLREMVFDASASIVDREQAIDALVKARDKELPPVLRQALQDAALRGAAIRALAAFEDSSAPAGIVAVYRNLAASEKRDALATLSSRKSYALALLNAIANEEIPSGDLPADLARQIKNLKDKAVTARLSEVWGSVSDQSADAKVEIARWMAILTNKPPRPEEASHGRAIFAKTCAQCHTLFGEGGKVGPDLTGSNRANLEYVLSNVLEPSAVMAKEYQTSTVTLADGRVVTGIIKAQDKQTVTVQTPNELLTYPRSDIENIQTAAISMMPIELVKPLSEDDVRALVAYLASPKQVAIPARKPKAQPWDLEHHTHHQAQRAVTRRWSVINSFQ
ncbi:MAG: PVC-type heme-binding CxxCH protein [Pirellulales bacterium]